jgi:hypothetical protein
VDEQLSSSLEGFCTVKFAWYGITIRNLRRNSMVIHLFRIFTLDLLSAFNQCFIVVSHPILPLPAVTVITLQLYAFRWHSSEHKAATCTKYLQTTSAFERRNVCIQPGNMRDRNQPPNFYTLMKGP